MQFNTFVSSTADLTRCVEAPNLTEVLIEPSLLAREGQLSDEAAQTLAVQAQQQGLRPVLVWDILMPERVLQTIGDRLKSWNLQQFAAIRVCDLGAAGWLALHAPEIPLQLIVETGNHNLEALQGWCAIFGSALERLILSIELPEDKLIEYCQILPVACEILGVGQILLFYSPRSLLSAHFGNADEETSAIKAFAAFDDAPNRHLRTVETVHGTFLFLDKDQFILDRLDALKAAGLHTVRLDLRHLGDRHNAAPNVDQICQQVLANPVALRQSWPHETRAPFFKANRTTSLFPRLKSKRFETWRDQCLAEVIASEKGKYVVFYTTQTFAIATAKRLLLPTGEMMDLPVEVLFRSVAGEPLETVETEQLLVTDWVKKTVPGTLLLAD